MRPCAHIIQRTRILHSALVGEVGCKFVVGLVETTTTCSGIRSQEVIHFIGCDHRAGGIVGICQEEIRVFGSPRRQSVKIEASPAHRHFDQLGVRGLGSHAINDKRSFAGNRIQTSAPRNVRASMPRNSVRPPVTRICSMLTPCSSASLRRRGGGIVIGIAAAVRERSLHGLDRERRRAKRVLVRIQFDHDSSIRSWRRWRSPSRASPGNARDYLIADFRRVTSLSVKCRNFPGGTSSCSGP